jgi:hypothetical protein
MGRPRTPRQVFSLFCYEPAALPQLLASWRKGPAPTHLLVTPGRAAAAVRALAGAHAGWNARRCAAPALAAAAQPARIRPPAVVLRPQLRAGRGLVVRGLLAGAPASGRSTPRTTTRTTPSSAPGSTGCRRRRPGVLFPPGVECSRLPPCRPWTQARGGNRARCPARAAREALPELVASRFAGAASLEYRALRFRARMQPEAFPTCRHRRQSCARRGLSPKTPS